MKALLLAFMLMFVAAPCFASPCDDTQGAASKARLEELKALSPEYIGEIEEAEIREKLKVVITTLSAAVSDLYAS